METVRAPSLAIGGLLAMAAAIGVGRFIYTPILPAMIEELGLSRGQAGLIAGANFAGYLAGALVAASPRLPGRARNWVIWSLLVSAITTAAMGLVSTLPAFLTLRFIGGGASAFVLVLASTLVLERLGSVHRSDLASWHFAGVGTGIALSALLVELVHRLDLGWRWTWWGGGAFSLVAVAAFSVLVPADSAARTASDRAEKFVAPPGLVPLITAYGLFGFGYVITATFIVAIVRGSPEIRQQEYLIWLIVGLSAIPSVAAWSAMAQRLGVFRAFAAACFIEAIGVLISVVLLNLVPLIVAGALLGGTFMGITALGLIAARALTRDKARRGLAAMTAAFGLGQAIGPVVAGYSFDITGSFFLASVLAAAGLVIAAVLALQSERASRRA